MTSINPKDPLREIRSKTADLDLEGIQKSLVKVTDKEVSWRGRAWKEVKESVNTLIRSAQAFRFISHEKHMNEKLKGNLPWLDRTVNTLNEALKKNQQSFKTDGESYTANLIVQDRVNKVNELLSKMVKTKGINKDNSAAIGVIQNELKKVSDFCSANLKSSTERMDKKDHLALEKDKLTLSLNEKSKEIKQKIQSINDWMIFEMPFLEDTEVLVTDKVQKNLNSLSAEIKELIKKEEEKEVSMTRWRDLAKSVLDKLQASDDLKIIAVPFLEQTQKELHESIKKFDELGQKLTEQ